MGVKAMQATGPIGRICDKARFEVIYARSWGTKVPVSLVKMLQHWSTIFYATASLSDIIIDGFLNIAHIRTARSS